MRHATPCHVVAARSIFHGIPRSDCHGKPYSKRHGNTNGTPLQPSRQMTKPTAHATAISRHTTAAYGKADGELHGKAHGNICDGITARPMAVFTASPTAISAVRPETIFTAAFTPEEPSGGVGSVPVGISAGWNQVTGWASDDSCRGPIMFLHLVGGVRSG